MKKYTILLDSDLFKHYTFHADNENSREGADLVSGIVRVCRKLTSSCHLTECSSRQLLDNDTFKFTVPGSTSKYKATKIYFTTLEQLQEQVRQLLETHPSSTQLHLLLMCVPRLTTAENVIFVGFTPKKKVKTPILPIKLDSIPESIDLWFKTKINLEKLEEYLFAAYTGSTINYIKKAGDNFSLKFGDEIEIECSVNRYFLELKSIVITKNGIERTLIRQNIVFHGNPSSVTTLIEKATQLATG